MGGWRPKTFLYKPLGMTSTSSRYSDFLSRQNRATLHAWYQDRWQALTKRMPDPQSPAGGAQLERPRPRAVDAARARPRQVRRQAGHRRGRAGRDAHAGDCERDKPRLTGIPEFYGLGWTLELRSDTA